MTIQNVSVAANAVSSNQLSGQLYEFLDRPMPVLLAAASSAVGLNCTFIIGGVAVVNDQPISQANRFPILPDDVVTAVRRAQGRLVLTFRNTTAGALTVNASIDVG
jgi:hypothetical protein